jgi:hypothetical protein
MADFDKVKDSGERQEFQTGSVRDTASGKGTPHLIGGEALYYHKTRYKGDGNYSLLEIIESNLLCYSEIVENRDKNMPRLDSAIHYTILYIQESEDGTYSSAMRRLAKHYENGAKKYAANNWRKGQPVSRYYDSAMRHLWACIDEKTDEDHAAALLWNLIGILQTKIDVNKGQLPKELDNFPFILEEVFGKKEGDK